MDDSNRVDFANAITAMIVTFGVEATKPLLHGYWLGLQDLSIEQVQFAVGRSMRECEKLPKPAELRKLSGAMIGHESRADLAWLDVQKAVPLGPYKHIDFQDKLCNAVIRSHGGWPAFVERFRNSESEMWARKDFVRVYVSFASSGVSGEVCLPLAGLAEAYSSGGNISPPPLHRITCDEARAKLPFAPKPSIGVKLAPRLEGESK